MHITRIELENIKSHASTAYDFERGAIAITGANGAGKTTLIEAVAWTLFDLLDYKKEDFLRRGTKKGSARVTFVSALDERLYTVYRDTATGYNVYDLTLKVKIAEKKEEVRRFLWQHLGVEPGTDLDSLFREAIGVPQAKFTGIFSDTETTRKKAFDKLLKVEEYRRGAEELLKTSRFIDGQIAVVRERIARAEGEISRIDAIEEEFRTLSSEVIELNTELEQVGQKAADKFEKVTVLDQTEIRLSIARADRDRLQSEKATLTVTIARGESELNAAREAAAKLEQVKGDHERHLAAVARLSELERERNARQQLRDQIAKTESALAAVRADQKYTGEALEKALTAHRTITSLKPDAAEQERLEAELATLRDARARVKAISEQIARGDKKLLRLRESYKENRAQLAAATEKSKKAAGLESLQTRDEEIVRELAALHAALERDERFQQEIQNGLCPILSQKCLNLEEGQSLEDFVTSQFTELRARIAGLETEKGNVAVALKATREAEKFLSELVTLQAREKDLAEEGKLLNEEKATLTAELNSQPQIEGELARVEHRLKELDNPKGKIQLLQVEAGLEGELRLKLSKIESNLERLESERRILVEQTEMYKELDVQWTEFTSLRDSTAAANRTFLANEEIAGRLAEREALFAGTSASMVECEKRVADAEKEYRGVEKEYDRELHAKERAALNELQRRQAELAARHEIASRRQKELASDLDRLAEIKKSIEEEFREKDKLEKTSELTVFIRDTLKEAAPLVARNYVYHVSAEANQMFREITGNAEQTLKWGEDYAITLEEDGYDRPFQSLSGGEQMAAALSVRLGLLKQLTDIRIAFFDEPTTNLDAERRENLALQLSQLIKHFDQLFVISHDDTFEGYVDEVVKVERGNGELAFQQSL